MWCPYFPSFSLWSKISKCVCCYRFMWCTCRKSLGTVKSIYAHFTALKRLSAAGKLSLLPRWVTNAARTCSLMHPTLNMKYVIYHLKIANIWYLATSTLQKREYCHIRKLSMLPLWWRKLSANSTGQLLKGKLYSVDLRTLMKDPGPKLEHTLRVHT